MQQIADWLEKLACRNTRNGLLKTVDECQCGHRGSVAGGSSSRADRFGGARARAGFGARLARVRVTKLVNTGSPRLRAHRHGEGRNAAPGLLSRNSLSRHSRYGVS